MSDARNSGMVLAKVHPKYLHTNSQSHLWPFSAIAELIDNAYDPDVEADVLVIKKEERHGKPCLVFKDNGNGMDRDHLIKMLSFGFCEKDQYNDDKNRAPIGQYGNGFKSGSMRLAKDALVFTVHKITESACVGLLSRTLCEDRNLDSIQFPIMEFRMPSLKRSHADLNMDAALEQILDVSPYNSEEELKEELTALRTQKKRSGTKIVLFNLIRRSDGRTELDFKSDPEDIRADDTCNDPSQEAKHSGYRQSLKRYCSILFREPKMKIEINGVEVRHFSFVGDLKETKKASYKPYRQDLKGKTVNIVFGKEKKTSSMLEGHGIMFYHRNRLIKPYVQLPCQKSGVGTDVVGVVDVTDVLKPTHFKQDFEVNTIEYRALIGALSRKMEKYCKQVDLDEDGEDGEDGAGRSQENKTWVSCFHCKKWRRLPNEHPRPLPKKWFCFLNTDITRNRCDIEEEDYSNEVDLSGPEPKGKRKSTDKKTTHFKRARQSSIVPREEPELSTSDGAQPVEAPHQEKSGLPSRSKEPALHRLFSNIVSDIGKKMAVLIPVQVPRIPEPSTWSSPSSQRQASPSSVLAQDHGFQPSVLPAPLTSTSPPDTGNTSQLKRKTLHDVKLEWNVAQAKAESTVLACPKLEPPDADSSSLTVPLPVRPTLAHSSSPSISTLLACPKLEPPDADSSSLTVLPPARPTVAHSSSPTASRPARPIEAHSSSPNALRPTKPTLAHSSSPTASQPARPIEAHSSSPNALRPTKPTLALSSSPTASQPTKPPLAHSSSLIAASPARPTVAHPSSPTASQPARPVVAHPTSPTASPPARPAVAHPTSPSASPPARPAVAHPSSPTASQPARPTVAHPSSPTASPPARPAVVASRLAAEPSILQAQFRRNVMRLLRYMEANNMVDIPMFRSEEDVEQNLQLVLGSLGVTFE